MKNCLNLTCIFVLFVLIAYGFSQERPPRPEEKIKDKTSKKIQIEKNNRKPKTKLNTDKNINNSEPNEIDVNEEIAAPPPQEFKMIVEEAPTYFVAVEEMPEPIGGIQAIQNKIVYPEIAKRAGVEGKVYVLAFINEQGEVTKAEIIKGLGAGLDEAALSAVKQTKFKPGKQRGKPVKVQVSIPILFKLQ